MAHLRITVLNATYARGGARDLVMEYVSWSMNALSFLVLHQTNKATHSSIIYQFISYLGFVCGWKNVLINTVLLNQMIFCFLLWRRQTHQLRRWSSPNPWPVWTGLHRGLSPRVLRSCRAGDNARLPGSVRRGTGRSGFHPDYVQPPNVLHQEILLLLLLSHAVGVAASSWWWRQRPTKSLHKLCSWWTSRDT